MDKDYSHIEREEKESEQIKFLENKMVKFKAYRRVYLRGEKQRDVGRVYLRDVFEPSKIQELDLCLQEKDERQKESLTGRKLEFIQRVSKHAKSSAIEEELANAFNGEKKEIRLAEWSSDSDY
jgi:hypothetical protein